MKLALPLRLASMGVGPTVSILAPLTEKVVGNCISQNWKGSLSTFQFLPSRKDIYSLDGVDLCSGKG